MRSVMTIFFLSAVVLVAPAWAQDAPATVAAAQGHSSAVPAPTQAEIDMQKRMAAQRNQERFAKIKKDTDQLLELATQLKKSVDEASDQKLSVDVIRKADQIEKLARQVRQKMLGD